MIPVQNHPIVTIQLGVTGHPNKGPSWELKKVIKYIHVMPDQRNTMVNKTNAPVVTICIHAGQVWKPTLVWINKMYQLMIPNTIAKITDKPITSSQALEDGASAPNKWSDLVQSVDIISIIPTKIGVRATPATNTQAEIDNEVMKFLAWTFTWFIAQ